jgi:uncharacterized protein YceH (UPF0502 family)
VHDLSAAELRVLGSLLEKQRTTPDAYPLTLNGLRAACNQTTSRDPLVHYTEREVDGIVLALREQGLARTVRGDGQRVHKHKHVLGDALHLERPSLAVLSVLMLRGPQTVNELRTRTERYSVDLDAEGVERVLQAMAAREEALVRLLPRRPGEREARWVHLLGGEAMAEQSANAPPSAPAARAAAGTARADEVAELRSRVDDLTRRFDVLLERLGETVE